MNIAQKYVSQIALPAVKACVNSGIFPSVVIAQALLEGNRGQDYKAALYNNPFGHKASPSWTGRIAQKVPGKGIKWRAYDTMEEAIKAHIKVLQRFKIQGVVSASTPKKQLEAIEKAPYNVGSDRSQYAEKLYRVIQAMDLQQYDNQMFALERQLNENSLAFHEQDGITRALHNLFA